MLGIGLEVEDNSEGRVSSDAVLVSNVETELGTSDVDVIKEVMAVEGVTEETNGLLSFCVVVELPLQIELFGLYPGCFRLSTWLRTA